MFHIDFGYIFGKDPKPFPPPMKLCREMVDAMNGIGSPEYEKFESYCYMAFNIIRKSSSLILNLIKLMGESSVFKSGQQIGTMENILLKTQQKLFLEYTDESAADCFKQLINDSVEALFPQFIETIHKWAQYWRK